MSTTPDPLERAERILTPARRRYLYRVSMALLPLLIAAGALEPGIAGQIALLIAALLGISVPAVAERHVPADPGTTD